MHSYQHITDYQYIDTKADLNKACKKLADKAVIAFDTEFVRTQTLNPLLGLIQVFDGETVYLIDPVAISDLSEFSKILEQTDIIKIAHSCSEDLETLLHHLNVIPQPIFDTQFAAALLGLGVSVGYANLVESVFNIKVDKGESRTDWLQRPLSNAQCDYALADVTHLLALYEHMLVPIEEQNKLTWVYDEIAHLAAKKQAVYPAELAYLSVKNNWKLRHKHLACLQKLAEWRMQTARREDKPLSFVLKETALIELAYKIPQANPQLFECQHLYSKPAKLYGDSILKICRSVIDAPDEAMPKRVQRLTEFRDYKQALEKLKALTEQISHEHSIPTTLFASKKQLNQVLKWCWFDLDELEAQALKPDLLCSWRYNLLNPFIPQLSAFLTGSHEVKRSI
ncbi:ribonuclease D [Glaciecola petra]|uniref:Ribonuclease D n=1 Tax=Glaciecola petra TaxID=3075602 RepID=A0ABU2ZMT7_9ALTE|nr:ribonuclease D [Aestuariibacter sp. P117]MDT0593939.1 ribonuclease D [Aestuariibacter sp. P117]